MIAHHITHEKKKYLTQVPFSTMAHCESLMFVFFPAHHAFNLSYLLHSLSLAQYKKIQA